MAVEALKSGYLKWLGSLREEIEKYEDSESLWAKIPATPNSGGNLCLHLIGNLNHFIGANLGGTGYVRTRDNEFSDSGISKDELILKIDETVEVVSRSLGNLSDDILGNDYPEMLFDTQFTNGEILVHMLGHFAYHLGQIDYHRRIVTQGA
ncbi:MAG: DUF1572 family protein [Pyrinomonadaceae bacterium]